MQKIFGLIEKILVLTGILLFPVFVLPGFASPYFVPKLIFLAIITALILIIKLVKSISGGEMKFSIGKFDIPLVLLVLVYILSTIFRTPNKMEAFLYPGLTSFVILSLVFYFVVNQFTKFSKKSVLISVFGSGILLAISMLFAEFKVFSAVPQLPSFIKDSGFNAIGSGIGSIIFLLTVLPIGIIRVVKEKDIVKKFFFGVSSFVILTSVIIIGAKILPGKANTLVLPSWQTSWSITIDTLKNNPILGVGPGNYLSAFNIYRPLSYNQSNLWQLRFSSASNYYFTLFTELGLAGIATLTVLLISIYKRLSNDLIKKGIFEEISIIILLFGFALIPGAPALTLLLTILLAVFSGSEEKSTTIATNRISTIIAASPIIVGIILLAIFGSKAVLAEMSYKKSLDALTKNDAQATFDYMTLAVKKNPYVDRYHASLAQIDLALANSIATKENLTDEDRNTISQLVQNAISEGKAAITLNIERSNNWEILGQIYKSILAFAQGSDQFAIQTYSQAVALDPISPDLRLNLGGVYYALGDYDNAITSFQLAIAAKNDYANAHYNLAAAYAAKKDFDKAISEMNTVLSFVEKDSDDYKTAQETLDSFKKQKPTDVTNSADVSQNLTQPETVNESNIKPPIELPQEATPPATTE